MQTRPESKKSILRHLRWRDLIVVVLGIALGAWLSRHAFHEPTDYQKWQARPQLRALDGVLFPRNAQSGLPPCFFLVPKGSSDQPVISGSVGDCLLLIPDGKKLDLFEIALVGGFAHIRTDLYIPDVIPLAFTRSVVPLDEWAKRNEVYLSHVYDPFLSGNRFPYTYVDWRLPDGVSIHYGRVSPGTGFADAIYEAPLPHPMFAGSRIKWNGWGWDLSLEEGTTYLSPEAYNATRPQQGSLVGIFDREGHEVRLLRKSGGALTEIDAPGGGWIKFNYERGRMIQARDSAGSEVKYDYDSKDRLVAVRCSTGSATQYSYDSSNRIVRLDDSSSSTTLETKYDRSGIVEQVTMNGDNYEFHHLGDDIDITDSKGTQTRVHVTLKDGNMSCSVENIPH